MLVLFLLCMQQWGMNGFWLIVCVLEIDILASWSFLVKGNTAMNNLLHFASYHTFHISFSSEIPCIIELSYRRRLRFSKSWDNICHKVFWTNLQSPEKKCNDFSCSDSPPVPHTDAFLSSQVSELTNWSLKMCRKKDYISDEYVQTFLWHYSLMSTM